MNDWNPLTVPLLAAAEYADARSAMLGIVAGLPRTQRLILLLLCFDGLNGRQIGEVLEMPYEQVEHQLVMALETVDEARRRLCKK